MASVHSCEVCGERAIIQIRNVLGGEVSVRYLCMECAEEEDRAAPVRREINRGVVLVTTGLYVLVISVFADQLGFGSADEFGWKQWVGMIVAGVCVLAGGLMRVPTLMAAGALLGVTTLAADWLGIGDRAGFGWQQALGAAVGAMLIAIGVALARRGNTSPEVSPTLR